jgi:hypothetical protein
LSEEIASISNILPNAYSADPKMFQENVVAIKINRAMSDYGR